MPSKAKVLVVSMLVKFRIKVYITFSNWITLIVGITAQRLSINNRSVPPLECFPE